MAPETQECGNLPRVKDCSPANSCTAHFTNAFVQVVFEGQRQLVVDTGVPWLAIRVITDGIDEGQRQLVVDTVCDHADGQSGYAGLLAGGSRSSRLHIESDGLRAQLMQLSLSGLRSDNGRRCD